MDIRRFRALRATGVSIAEIARETGHDWRTVKKYLADDAPVAPPAAASRSGTQPLVIAPFIGLVDGWLRRDIRLRASVIHERLVAEYGFTGHYQRVKVYVAEARPRIAAELAGDDNPLVGLHRRFEVVPGAQAQVDWGDEGGILAHVGVPKVYSFHMVLSYSRDPFICYVTSQDAASFFDCHRRAFAHFGGVPASIVYDRTKTIVKRHVAPGLAVPLHPDAVAFAGHYRFSIDVLAAYRPTGKGRVERLVDIARDHLLAGRGFDSIAAMDAAFTGWVPIRRAQTHRTHGQVIGLRAAVDHAALLPLPDRPYLVTDRHLRRVGKDCLVSFEASLYSVPARAIQAGQRLELRVTGDLVAIHTPGGGEALAVHRRAAARGSWVVDPTHWAGLPDGGSRATTIDPPPCLADPYPAASEPANPLAALLTHNIAAGSPVARRPLSDYAAAAATR